MQHRKEAMSQNTSKPSSALRQCQAEEDPRQRHHRSQLRFVEEILCVTYSSITWQMPGRGGSELHICVIGSVAAGTSVAAKARRNSEDVRITVFEKDSDISYSVCGLPYYLSMDISRDQLIPRDQGWFMERFGIEILTRHEVVSIDKDRRSLQVLKLDSQETMAVQYDALVIATGAYPFIPRLPGIDREGVFAIRNVHSADRIKNYLKAADIEDVVVVGAGYIGLEMADCLSSLGLNTSVVEMGSQVMPSMDPDMAVYVEMELERMGIKVYLDRSVVEAKGDPRVSSVILSDGSKLRCGLLIMATGVRPCTDLAAKAQISLGMHGAIRVNQYMETSVPGIYAVGDCAEHRCYITDAATYRPLGSTANKMGRIAGDRITGGDLAFRGVLGTGILKVGGLTVGHTGISERQGSELGFDLVVSHNIKPNHPKYYPDSAEIVLKGIAKRKSGQLIGAQVVGGEGADKRLDVMVTAISLQASVDDLFHLDLAYAPPYSTTKDPVAYTGMVLENAVKRGRPLITPDQLVRRMEEDGRIAVVDVRPEDQYALGHVRGAVNIPWTKMRSRICELDKDLPTVTYCNKGVSGNAAQNLLLNKGFKEVYNLSGGYRNYSAQMRRIRD